MIKSSRTKRRRLQEEIASNELFNEDNCYVENAISLLSTSTNYELAENPNTDTNTNFFIQFPHVLETNVDNSLTYHMSPNNFESIENDMVQITNTDFLSIPTVMHTN